MQHRDAITSPKDDPWQIREFYDRMWAESLPHLHRGDVEIDPTLAAGAPDVRRGLTLLARPSAAVRERVQAFMEELREIEPAQHYYSPAEVHVTVLSLFTATPSPEPFLARRPEYLAAVDEALPRFGRFKLFFRGVTASRGAVMLQGFFQDSALNDFRDVLRGRLHARGLTAGLDKRYRIVTAHATFVRFRAPLQNPERFASHLEHARSRDFGQGTTVSSLELVVSDWYMTQRVTRVIREYSGIGEPNVE